MQCVDDALATVHRAVATGNDFTAADKSLRDEGKQRIKDWTDVCVKLGAPVLRVFADTNIPGKKWPDVAGGATRAQVEGWMADDFRECAEYAAKQGIFLGVQNHGDFLRTSEEQLRLVTRVDSEWCGPIVDTGYYKTEDPYKDIAAVAPHAVNWQIKETLGSSLKTAPTDFHKLAKIIHDGGYRGFVPIETLAMGRNDYDPAAEVVKVLLAMREAIGAVR